MGLLGQHIYNELGLISDKEVQAVKTSSLIALKPNSYKEEEILKKINYPNIDKNSKITFIYNNFSKSYHLDDKKLSYTINPSDSGRSADIIFQSNKDGITLKRIVPTQDIFTNLKTLIYIFLKANKKQSYKFMYEPATENDKDEGFYDNPKKQYFKLSDIDKSELDDYVFKKDHTSMIHGFGNTKINYTDSEEQIRENLDKGKVKFFKWYGENYKNDIKFEALYKKFVKQVIKFKYEHKRSNKISLLRKRMYEGLLNKLGKEVKKAGDGYYSFTVSLADVS